MIDTRDHVAQIAHELHQRHHQLSEWLRIEETSREGAHEWKAEVLRGRLQEIDWAIELVEQLEK